jgi:acetyl esterase/lipase
VIVTAGLDTLHSEGCSYANQLRSAGVDVVHRDFPGLFHGFMTIQALPAAASALQLACRDLRRLLHPVGSERT